MVSKSDFTPEEWNELLQGPMLAGIAVTAADPSGLIGLLKESFASAAALAKVRTDPSSNELVRAIVTDMSSMAETSGAREGIRAKLTGARPAEIKTRAISGLMEISALLERKAPQDARAFKEWMRDISQSVAEASAEGGFLGFGGVKVSDAEKATLSEIDRALQLA